jgi:hypothetical protein
MAYSRKRILAGQDALPDPPWHVYSPPNGDGRGGPRDSYNDAWAPVLASLVIGLTGTVRPPGLTLS